jgi:hypothetical protein
MYRCKDTPRLLCPISSCLVHQCHNSPSWTWETEWSDRGWYLLLSFAFGWTTDALQQTINLRSITSSRTPQCYPSINTKYEPSPSTTTILLILQPIRQFPIWRHIQKYRLSLIPRGDAFTLTLPPSMPFLLLHEALYRSRSRRRRRRLFNIA